MCFHACKVFLECSAVGRKNTLALRLCPACDITSVCTLGHISRIMTHAVWCKEIEHGSCPFSCLFCIFVQAKRSAVVETESCREEEDFRNFPVAEGAQVYGHATVVFQYYEMLQTSSQPEQSLVIRPIGLLANVYGTCCREAIVVCTPQSFFCPR